MAKIGEVYEVGYGEHMQRFVVISRDDEEEEAQLMNAFGFVIKVPENSLRMPCSFLPHFENGMEALRNLS